MLRHLLLHPRILCGSLALLVLVSSGFAASARVREYVDEITAVSITVSVGSLIFARERADLAANARDYITLAPLEINCAGTRSYFWSGYLWSTIDRRERQPILDAGDRLFLLADGRPIVLAVDGRTLREHGVAQPPTPAPVRTAIPVLFATHPEEIAYVAHARNLRIQIVRDAGNEAFLLWRDASSDVRQFVEQLNLER